MEFTRTVLRDGNRGRNKRGLCAHKRTKRTSRAKGQLQTGYAPSPVTAYTMDLAR